MLLFKLFIINNLFLLISLLLLLFIHLHYILLLLKWCLLLLAILIIIILAKISRLLMKTIFHFKKGVILRIQMIILVDIAIIILINDRWDFQNFWHIIINIIIIIILNWIMICCCIHIGTLFTLACTCAFKSGIIAFTVF